MSRKLHISLKSSQEAAAESRARVLNTLATAEYAGEVLTFTTPELLFQVFTSNRWQLIGKLQELGTVSIRELARQLNRDVRRVHDDVKALLEHGIIEQNESGVSVPFEEIHTDFTLKKAA